MLVLGASGTLGATAVQAAKLLGAARVVGAARRVEAVPAEADEVVRLEGDYGCRRRRSSSTASGASRPSGRSPRPRPASASSSSASRPARPRRSSPRGCAARWRASSAIRSFAVPPEVRAEGYRELCVHARDGRIHFDVETYPLEQLAEAWERQSSGSPGVKIVVELT